MGHAEPAAGLIGLLHLTASLQHAHSAPLHHLRILNPLVAGILAQHPRGPAAAHWDLRKVGGQNQQALAMKAPRAASGLGGHSCSSGSGTCEALGDSTGGVSAFAFQGTNAHVVVTASMWASRRHNQRSATACYTQLIRMTEGIFGSPGPGLLLEPLLLSWLTCKCPAKTLGLQWVVTVGQQGCCQHMQHAVCS